MLTRPVARLAPTVVMVLLAACGGGSASPSSLSSVSPSSEREPLVPAGGQLMVSTPEEGLSLVTGAGRQLASFQLPHADSTTWSADGQQLAFSGVAARGGTEIYTLHSGSPARPLTGQQASFNPVWSLDGNWIAFTEITMTPKGGASRIWIIHSDGSGIRPLTDLAPGRSDTPGGYNPVNGRLAFTRCWPVPPQSDGLDPDTCAVWTMAADGSDQRLLARDSEQPVRSPDGRQIAFVSTRDHAAQVPLDEDYTTWIGQIYVMRADGSQQRRLLTTATNDRAPSWAPGGDVIAFQTTGTQADSWSYVDLVNADGSCRRRIPLAGTGLSTGYRSPAWRPGPAVPPLTC
jgi:Tol biopolymer transport system component